MKKIPNILTLARIILAICFVFLYLNNNIIIATIVFFIASITDTVDGWLARKINAVSKWGALYDPLADKLLTIFALICLTISGIVELWMVIIIILRDIVTTIIRLNSFVDKHIPTSNTAKIKTFLQMLIIATILILLSIGYVDIVYSDIVYYVMLGLTIITVWTMIEYIYKIVKSNLLNR